MRTSFRLFLLLFALFAATSTPAHEFWIDPVETHVAPGGQLVADLRVGQNFTGASRAYLPHAFSRFDLATPQGTFPVPGVLGNRPAMSMLVTGEGLGVILHETLPEAVTYSEWDVFRAFLAHKGYDRIAERHLARGLPQTGFTELYTRHAKSLVQLGDGAGQDRAFGLMTEFVARANPYTDDMSSGLPVVLLLRGAPRAGAQIQLWQRDPDGQVSVQLLQTDALGRAVLPVLPGHSYLADAVTLEELAPETANGAVWRSFWASLTFEIP